MYNKSQINFLEMTKEKINGSEEFEFSTSQLGCGAVPPYRCIYRWYTVL